MTRHLLHSLLAIPLSLFFVASASAAVVTWDGGGADDNWGTCNNWSSNACPTSSDVATFDATSTDPVNIAVTLTGATAPAGIDINVGYTGTITQNNGVSITIGATGFDQAAGTFMGGDSSITNNGALTISGGTFTSTSDILTVVGAFNNSGGGAFEHNNGTLTLTGAGTTLNVNSTETFYNLTINITASAIRTVDNSDSITVSNVLTLTDGSLNQSTIPAAGTIVVNGSISHGANFDGGTAQVNLEGSGTASFVSGSMTGFKLNGAGVVVTGPSSGTLTFENDVTVANGTFNAGDGAIALSSGETFTQSGGIFNGGTGTVTFPSTVTISSGTFNGGTRTDFSCSSCTFTFSGGTLAPGSGTLNVATNWTQSAGATFTEGTSTVAFVNGNGTKTIDVNSTETFYNLTIGDVSTSGWTKLVAADDTLNVSNNLILFDGNFNQTTIPTAGTVSVSKDVTVASGFDGGTAKLVFSGGSNQNFDLTGVTGAFNGDITVNKSGGEVSLLSDLVMNASSQDLTIEEGTFDLSGYALTVQGSATEKLIIETGGNLQLQGGETITADSASYPQLDSGSKVTYDGTVGSYTLKDYTYHHLTINGSGATFNPAANETLGGDLTVTAGTFDVNDLTLAINGNTLINGGTVKSGTNTVTFGNAGGDTVTISSGGLEIESDVPASDIVKNAGTWTNSGGTITYNAATGITGVILSGLSPYYNLTINSSGSTYSLQALTDADGNLTITAGTLDVSGSNYGITVGGNWANTGTFTQRSGTVTFDTAGTTSTISGNTTFNNFTCTTAGKALTFTAGTTQTISGLITLTGASGNLIVLRSTVTDTAWNLTVNGTSSVDYVNVRDSNAGGGNAITHAVSASRSVNVANNTNWSFNAAPTVASVTGVQAANGTTNVTLTFVMDDPDDDNTLQAKVEYSLDGGSTWNDPTLSTEGADTSATQGDPSVNNAATYQVGQSGTYILSSSGANTVTTVWVGATDLLTTIDISNARIRITPYDGTVEGTASSSSNFILDRVSPTGLANFSHVDFSSAQAILTWTVATDTNFNHYEIWSGTDESQVIARSGSAVEWDNDNDAALTTASTSTTTINDIDPRNKYFKIFAVDNYGNEVTLATYYISGGKSSEESSSFTSSGSGSGSGGTDTTEEEEVVEEEEMVEEEELVEEEEMVEEEELVEEELVEEEEVEEEEVEEEEVEEEEETEETAGPTWEDFDVQPEEGHWSEGYVKYLEEQTNIVEVAVSQPTFLEILMSILETPNAPMPRGNALEFLLVLAGYSLDTMTINVRSLAFEDVSLDDDQAGFIQFAYEQRLVQGYPDGTFQPDRTVNRAEALKLCSYFFEGDWSQPIYGDELLERYELTENPFTDVDLNQWYAPYLINAYAKGVVNGYGDGTFGPGNDVTYAEFLKIATLMQNSEEAVELAEELE